MILHGALIMFDGFIHSELARAVLTLIGVGLMLLIVHDHLPKD